MRLIDMANAWAARTHLAYQTKLNFIRQFENYFGFHCLRTPTLAHPPNNLDIPLMWMHECYSLRQGRSQLEPVVFGTLRSLRSAAGQFLAWNTICSSNGSSYIDSSRRVYEGPCRLTDNLAFSLFSQGQATRIGNHSQPSTALLDRHVRWLDANLRQRLQSASTPSERLWLATAGFLNLTLWLGWLRSQEALTIRWCDVDVLPPHLSTQADLPPGLGVLTFRLNPATKASRTITADVVIAYRCKSGLSLGWWWDTLLNLQPDPTIQTSEQFLFTRPPRDIWTSYDFRHQVLYPALTTQQLQGDNFLRPFVGSNSIPARFWSLNSYRRGARTHSQRGGSFKRATDQQVYEHGRWRHRREREPIAVAYREWSLRERVLNTFYSF